MGVVFVLQHAYEQDDGADEVKFIGVYSTQENAGRAIGRLHRLDLKRSRGRGRARRPWLAPIAKRIAARAELRSAGQERNETGGESASLTITFRVCPSRVLAEKNAGTTNDFCK